VGDTSFAILPEVTKEHTFLLTFIFQLVRIHLAVFHWSSLTTIQIPLVKLWFQPDWDTFVGAVTLCGYASFLFGWHVHEKAVLLIIIPFSLIALKDRRYFSAFRPLAVAGHVSLFPLLFTAAEFPLKTVYTIFWLVLFLFVFDRVAPVPERPRIFVFDRLSLLYLTISIPLIVYCSLGHHLIFGCERLQFLPLMFMSSYSALGVVGSWVGFMVVYFIA
jgi:alpha-1,3-glucosyltransferase